MDVQRGEKRCGAACDGADADLCNEGTYSCSSGAQACSDTSGDTVEVCNGADDDCDGEIDEDFDLDADLANCGACGNACGGEHATPSCDAGSCALGVGSMIRATYFG